MSTPRFLAENLFDPTLFGDAAVSANEEATGHEAWRVGTRRRSPDNYWTPTTANSDAWVEVKLAEPRAADLLVLDRVHNLSGEEVKLQVSDDDFTTTETVLTETLPSASRAVGLSEGARMPDGAWALAFDARVATYWRVLVSAMGSGLKPEVGGLYLGTSWRPGFHLERPFGWGDTELRYQQVQGPNVWSASSQVARRKTKTYRLRLPSFSAYESARYHTDGLFWRGVPMWVWPDADHGERGWLAKSPPGIGGWRTEQGWGFPQADLACPEHQPEM